MQDQHDLANYDKGGHRSEYTERENLFLLGSSVAQSCGRLVRGQHQHLGNIDMRRPGGTPHDLFCDVLCRNYINDDQLMSLHV